MLTVCLPFLPEWFSDADDKRGSGSLGGYMDPLSSGFRPNQESPEERGLNDFKDEQKTGRPKKHKTFWFTVAAPEMLLWEGASRRQNAILWGKNQKICRKWLFLAIFSLWLGLGASGGKSIRLGENAHPWCRHCWFKVFEWLAYKYLESYQINT